MSTNPRCPFMALIGIIGLVVCLTSLLHIFSILGSQLSISQIPLQSSSQTLLAADFPNASYRELLANIRPSDVQVHSRTLGVASHIYVLSLPRRADRRRSMDTLAQALDLHFEYIDGVDASDIRIDHAFKTLKRDREEFRKKFSRNRGGLIFPGFAFPSPLEDQSIVKENVISSVTHPLVSSPSLAATISASIPPRAGVTPGHNKQLPFACATPEDPFPDLLSETELRLTPPWRILSRGMVACWMAHVSVIQRIANLPDDKAVVIVLEDDVDMEFDIERRLRGMWPRLPHNGWDIVMLGYCHSDEMSYPPLTGAASLRPSSSPKCTHAYALSRYGARKLFQILSTSGFAYSRALDQATNWLIKTNQLRSYSIVPAIVVQRRVTRSDIWRPYADVAERNQNASGSEKGSKWRDALVDSTLERVEMLASRLGIGADV